MASGLNPYLLQRQARGGDDNRSPFDAYFQAREQRNAFEKYEREGKARDLAGQYLTGNKAAAQELARTDPGAFMDAEKFQRQQAAEKAGRIASILYAANTPEKYAQATAQLRAEGHEFDPGEDAWENRESLIAEGMTVAQQVARANADRDFAFKERDFAADQAHRAATLDIDRQRLAQGSQRNDLASKMQERAAAAEAMGLQPGSPEYTQFTLTGNTGDLVKGAANEEKARLRQEQKRPYQDSTLNSIEEARRIINASPNLTTGFGGQVLGNIGGTQANDLRALLDTVKANVGFEKLQAMREASPTGGALGQVSDFENRLLQSVLASLDQSQTKEQLLANLDRVREVTDRIVNQGIRPEDVGGGQRSDRLQGTGQTSTGLKWSVE